MINNFNSIKDYYEWLTRHPEAYFRCNGDIIEHLSTLKELAYGKEIVEFGSRYGSSTTAFLAGNPLSLTSFDMGIQPQIEELWHLAFKENIDFVYIEEDINNIYEDVFIKNEKDSFPETDILFIDTLHICDQLVKELKFERYVNERIILHDTVTFWEKGEVENTLGLKYAIEPFLEKNKYWIIEKHYTNNNGLMVLKRK